MQQILKNVELFKNLPDSLLRELLNRVKQIQVDKDTVIFEEGDLGDKLYFIISGNVEITIENKQGIEVTFSVLKPGEFFGEMSLFTDHPRSASALATTNCELAYLLKSDVQALMLSNPEIAMEFIKVLSNRLVCTNRIITQTEDNQLFIIYEEISLPEKVDIFIQYLRSLTSKEVFLIETDKALSKINSHSNCIFIVKVTKKLSQFLENKAPCIVRVTANPKPDTYSISPDTTATDIQKLARKMMKKTIGIALSSGTASGLAHIGVMKVLLENNIPLDYISGTSGGALYGSTFAFGHCYEDIFKVFSEVYDKPLYRLWDPSFSLTGIFEGRRLLQKTIAKLIGNKQIEDSLIPFAAVSTDLYSGLEQIITSGNLLQAVRASLSIPIIFTPVKKQEKLLIDGVVTTPIPISALELANIDIKIAVYVSELTAFNKKRPDLLSVFLRSRNISSDFIADTSAEKADVIIKPVFTNLKQFDYNRIREVIEAGEKAAIVALPRINRFLKN